MLVGKLAVAATLAIAVALAAFSTAAAQGPDIRIAELQCTGNPEVVTIENGGDAAQDLTGWTLVSDPTSSESFDLSALGGLQPGASVFIQSGPFASGVFNWGPEFVFRDDDATDFARLVDDEGAIVDEVPCAEPTPAETPEPSPAPSPEPTSADVPNGGGLPPPPGGLSPSAIMVFAGSILASLGAVTAAIPWLGSSSVEAAAEPVRLTGRRERSARSEAAFSWGIGLAVMGIVVALAVALIVDGRGARR
jgi:hypothetical protein